MIDRAAKLSVSRQAILLGISRGGVYYQPRPVSDADLKLMRRIDRFHTEYPFAGSRMLQGLLVQEGFSVGRLWRTIKYEEVYLRAYASVSEARSSIGRYLAFYNGRRPHSSLDGKTPDQAYFNPLTPHLVAA